MSCSRNSSRRQRPPTAAYASGGSTRTPTPGGDSSAATATRGRAYGATPRPPWSESPRVEVFWWCDYIGRKHCAHRRQAGRAPRLAWTPARWPEKPLWHIYPDGLAYRDRDGVRELVAACGCGAAGTLPSLGWAGPSCGPCHDRRLDGLPPARRADSVRGSGPRGSKGPPGVLSPDGRVMLARTVSREPLHVGSGGAPRPK